MLYIISSNSFIHSTNIYSVSVWGSLLVQIRGPWLLSRGWESRLDPTPQRTGWRRKRWAATGRPAGLCLHACPPPPSLPAFCSEAQPCRWCYLPIVHPILSNRPQGPLMHKEEKHAFKDQFLASFKIGKCWLGGHFTHHVL